MFLRSSLDLFNARNLYYLISSEKNVLSSPLRTNFLWVAVSHFISSSRIQKTKPEETGKHTNTDEHNTDESQTNAKKNSSKIAALTAVGNHLHGLVCSHIWMLTWTSHPGKHDSLLSSSCCLHRVDTYVFFQANEMHPRLLDVGWEAHESRLPQLEDEKLDGRRLASHQATHQKVEDMPVKKCIGYRCFLIPKIQTKTASSPVHATHRVTLR